MSGLTTDPVTRDQAQQLLDSGTWADLVAFLVARFDYADVEVELAASQATINSWIKGTAPRPLTEWCLRRSLAEWLGVRRPAAPCPIATHNPGERHG